ncbi:MAG: glycosyltransferase [Candidatus Paceibacterota bacterium]|jgi:glycosyltransferase involved in cell wall biosynthesis
MKTQKNKKIAITWLSPNAYSETFIKAQVDLLPASIVLHSDWLPNMINSKEIVNKYKRHINNFFRPILKFNIFSQEKALVKILKNNKIEAVLAQYGPGGCAMLPVCEKANIPLFVHFHGFDASEKLVLEHYSKKYKELFYKAKAIFVVSKKMQEKILSLGCPNNKLILNCYGPSNAFLNNRPDFNNNIFFSVGRFVNKKAPYLTIMAFIQVLEKYPEAKLIIGGNGELLNTCKNIVKTQKKENNIIFPGILKPKEVLKYMQNSLAFVQHSIIAESGDSEGTPVAILEASAAALPVIATYHGGIPDVIINNETGMLVDEYDTTMMANAMIKLIENKSLAKKMGLAGRERIKKCFSMDKYISKLRDVINDDNL